MGSEHGTRAQIERRTGNMDRLRIFPASAILITLSFLFYIPVALFARRKPALGMLMIPKTICYILLILFWLIW